MPEVDCGPRLYIQEHHCVGPRPSPDQTSTLSLTLQQIQRSQYSYPPIASEDYPCKRSIVVTFLVLADEFHGIRARIPVALDSHCKVPLSSVKEDRNTLFVGERLGETKSSRRFGPTGPSLSMSGGKFCLRTKQRHRMKNG